MIAAPGRSHYDHLPSEIQLRLCEFLEKEDACNFRLVNRVFGELGATVLVRYFGTRVYQKKFPESVEHCTASKSQTACSAYSLCATIDAYL